MFTGIIETTGRVINHYSTPEGLRLTLDVSKLSEALQPGDSLAINGVCLTAVNPTAQHSHFEVISETLQRTSLDQVKIGQLVNLEPAMSARSKFDGHFVQGHVDATGIVEEVVASIGERIVWISCDQEAQPLIVPQGSITINGISLTISQTKLERFSVAIIPTTLQRTNISDLQTGDKVNIETDIMARTIRHQLMAYFSGQGASATDKSSSTKPHVSHTFINLLKEHGFT